MSQKYALWLQVDVQLQVLGLSDRKAFVQSFKARKSGSSYEGHSAKCHLNLRQTN